MTIIERITDHIAPFPYASEGRVHGIFGRARIMPKIVAMEMPLLQLNTKHIRRYIVIDVDRKTAGLDWSKRGIPPPNLIVINPQNGHAHLIYELAKPVSLRNSDNRPGEALPVRLYKAVRAALTRELDGDAFYNGLLAKNPLHPSWMSIPGRLEPYTLSELAKALDLTLTVPHAQLAHDLLPGERNCGLFDLARKWAYRAKRNFRFMEDFRDSVYDEIYRLNDQLNDPLDRKECNWIAKSVSDWVWDRYTGSGDGKRRGIMQLDPTLPLSVRQQMGQKGSCQYKVDKTVSRIRSAILALRREGSCISVSAVSRRSNLHRNTISRHWSKFSELLHEDYKISSLQDGFTSRLTDTLTKTVNFTDSLPQTPYTLIPTQRCGFTETQIIAAMEKYSENPRPRTRALLDLVMERRRLLN